MSDSFGTDVRKRTELLDKAVRQYSDMIFRIAYQYLKNRHDAEDILQEVSVALVTKNAPLGDEVHLKRWLVRVTLNKCRDFRKSFWRKNIDSIDDYRSLEAPEQNGIMEELWELPENQRIIIYLYYYESFTIAEIAQMLGKSPNTVSSRLQRARKKLKTILKEGG